MIRSAKNQGTPRATNQGFRAARGNYVYGLSADDIVLPGFFEAAMTALEKHPDAGLAYGDFLTVTQGLEILERTPSLPPVETYYSPDQLSHLLYGDLLEARGAIFQRQALLSCGGFIPELEEMSDWFLGLAVAFRYGLHYVPGACHAKRVDFMFYALKRQACRDGLQEKIRRIIKLLERPENRDLLPHFARSAPFMHFGFDAAEALLKRPECWDPVHQILLHEPLAEYMQRKRDRVQAQGRTRNRPQLSRPETWQKYVVQYTPEALSLEPESFAARVRDLVSSWNRRDRRVVLFGAGEVTSRLFQWTNIDEADLVAIAEPVEMLQGEVIWNLETVAPAAIRELSADTVLVCSNAVRREVDRELESLERDGFEVVRLRPSAGIPCEKSERPQGRARSIDRATLSRSGDRRNAVPIRP